MGRSAGQASGRHQPLTVYCAACLPQSLQRHVLSPAPGPGGAGGALRRGAPQLSVSRMQRPLLLRLRPRRQAGAAKGGRWLAPEGAPPGSPLGLLAESWVHGTLFPLV